jgi:Glycosyl transferase family 2
VLTAMRAPGTSVESVPLEASLTTQLPDPLEVGTGTLLYLEGLCDSRADAASLEVVIAEIRTTAAVERIPPREASKAICRWWALVEIATPPSDGEAEVELHGRLSGREAATTLGVLRSVEIDPSCAPPAPSFVVRDGGPLIAICMATHEPDPGRLARQLESIRAQDWEAWVCVISDDASSPAAFQSLQDLTAGDQRFVISRSERRLGFYRNFERALRMTPAEASFVALADQDDIWHADKLTALRGALVDDPEAQLAYSDMRILDRDGKLVSGTYWILRRNRSDSVTSLLVANTVTGAASLFRRELLETALPFPPPVGEPYHDHWLAVCSLSAGGLAYLDRPTYDRVRHLESVTAGTRHAQVLHEMAGGSPEEGSDLRPVGQPPRDLAAVYRDGFLQAAQFARTAILRLDGRIEPQRRRELQRFADADSTPLGPLRLGIRSLRAPFGRNETLGRERAFAAAILWRRRAGFRARRGPRI